jgi:hypothetical protein
MNYKPPQRPLVTQQRKVFQQRHLKLRLQALFYRQSLLLLRHPAPELRVLRSLIPYQQPLPLQRQLRTLQRPADPRRQQFGAQRGPYNLLPQYRLALNPLPFRLELEHLRQAHLLPQRPLRWVEMPSVVRFRMQRLRQSPFARRSYEILRRRGSHRMRFRDQGQIAYHRLKWNFHRKRQPLRQLTLVVFKSPRLYHLCEKTASLDEIASMVSAGTKTAADAARPFNLHPATVSQLLARAGAGAIGVTI